MKNTDLYSSFVYVDDDILERSEKAAGHKVMPLRRRIAAAVAAACLAVVLMGAGIVASHWDSVQNWIAYQWENSTGEELSDYQTDVIESLSQEIGVSQTLSGVTVTVDSAALFDTKLEFLLRVEGLELPDEGRIDIRYNEVKMNSEWVGSAGMSEFGYDNGAVIIPLDITCAALEDSPYVDVEVFLKDFVVFETWELLAEGEWELEFTVKNEEFEVMELPDAEIMADYVIFDDVSEELPQKIDESCTDNGITVTVDSVKVMPAHFELLVRVDGIDIPKDSKYIVYGDKIALTADPTQCAGFTGEESGDVAKDGVLLIKFVGYTDEYDYSEPLNVTLNMSDFMAHEDTREMIAVGEWSVTFALDPEQIYEEEITSGEMPVTITNVELTSTGITFEFEYEHGGIWDPELKNSVGEKRVYVSNRAWAVLEDGTEIYANYKGGSGTGRKVTDPVQHWTYNVYWPAPIDIDEVVEIHIGDTVIPVK